MESIKDNNRISSKSFQNLLLCALGAIINDETIPKLTCKIVAGSANNQLEENRHGRILHEKGILYAPDYVINAGGLIAIYIESKHGTVEEAMEKLEEIGEKIDKIIAVSKENNEPTYEIANRLADERVSDKKRSGRRAGKHD